MRACKYVDVAIPQQTIDKFESARKLNASLLFVGDDWYNSDRWQEMEQKLDEVGCKVTYFPYTTGTSSTLINHTLLNLRDGKEKAE